MTFVEENPKAVKVILQNAKDLGLSDSIKVYPKSVHSILQTILNDGVFDFVFLDPPYEKGHEEKVIENWPWNKLISEDGRVCLEMAYSKEKEPPHSPLLKIVRDERYGDSRLVFYQLSDQLNGAE